MKLLRRQTTPGFGLSLGVTSTYLGLIVLLPIAGLLLKAAGLGWDGFVYAAFSPRALATYKLTVGAALAATAFNAFAGTLLAWVLTRYQFPGRRIADALIDLPFALPTAVAGIALATLFGPSGAFGRPLDAFGIKVAYAPLGVALAMAFIGLPFVVRSVQSVLEPLERDVEEAAASLGARDWTVITRVIAPAVFPALVAGLSLCFARSLGEYGAVVFIAGNIPMETEISSLLAIIRLEEFDYEGAAAVSTVMLAAALVMLLATSAVQAWSLSWNRRS